MIIMIHYLKIRKKTITLCMLNILILSAFSPIMISQSSFEDISNFQVSLNEKELHLLRVEHYLELKADQDVLDNFNVRYAFPPDYQYQVPIYLEIFDDSTADIINYYIEEDSFEPNLFVNFTISSIHKDENVLIHFTVWVLVINHDFSDLPNYVKFPKENDLPEETEKWLKPSDVVQVNNIFIKIKAREIRGFCNNLIRFAEEVAPFIKEHRFLLFLAQLYLGVFFSQDAVTTLFINGENVGRSHLACAFLRNYGVPTRVLLVNNDQGFWTQMHYMAEYYCPGYGWVLIETTRGESPYETKRQVINRICYPEDEMNTKTDYIFPLMTGEERWIWIDNEDVNPYYIDCDEGSKSQMFSESVISSSPFTVDYSFMISENVFNNYKKYLGLNLSVNNSVFFENAISFQEIAISQLKVNQDIFNYIFYMEKAFDEYKKME